MSVSRPLRDPAPIRRFSLDWWIGAAGSTLGCVTVVYFAARWLWH